MLHSYWHLSKDFDQFHHESGISPPSLIIDVIEEFESSERNVARNKLIWPSSSMFVNRGTTEFCKVWVSHVFSIIRRSKSDSRYWLSYWVTESALPLTWLTLVSYDTYWRLDWCHSSNWVVTDWVTELLSQRQHWLDWCDPGEWWLLLKTWLMLL